MPLSLAYTNDDDSNVYQLTPTLLSPRSSVERASCTSPPNRLQRHISTNCPSSPQSPVSRTFTPASLNVRHRSVVSPPLRPRMELRYDQISGQLPVTPASLSDNTQTDPSLDLLLGRTVTSPNRVSRLLDRTQSVDDAKSFMHLREAYHEKMEKNRQPPRENTPDAQLLYEQMQPYSQLVLDLLTSKRIRGLLILLDFTSDLMLLGLYLVELTAISLMTTESEHSFYKPYGQLYWLHTPRSEIIWQLVFSFSICSAIALVTRLVFTESFLRALFSFSSLVDLLTCIPVLVIAAIPGGRLIYVPYFLRAVVVVPHLRRLLNVHMEVHGSTQPFEPLRERIIILIVTLHTILYMTMCSLAYVELHWGDQRLSMIELIYFVVVTISTVGYGDVTPQSAAGRCIVCAAIIVALCVVPGLISSVVEALRVQNAGTGVYKKGRIPHVVITGKFESISLVTDILQAFYNNGWNKSLKLVFLSPQPAGADVKAILSTPLYEKLTCYIQGSVLNEANLARAQVKHAAATFLISDSSVSEDERNVFRAWAINKYAPLVPLYVFTQRPELEFFHTNVATFVVCAQELRQVLMGYNCLYRGVSTMIVNLVTSSAPQKHYRDLWDIQYGDGTGNEIYADTVNPCFVNLRMNDVSAFLFKEYQIILFAVRVRVPSKHIPHDDCHGIDINFSHLTLNPGSTYTFQEFDECFFIAQNVSEVYAVRKLDAAMFQQLVQTNQHVLQSPEIDRNSSALDVTQTTRTLLKRLGPLISDLPKVHCDVLISNLDEIFRPADKNCIVAQPDGPFASHRTPLCHLLRNPISNLKDIVLNDADHLHNHIIVLTSGWDMFQFMCTVRAAQLPAEQIRPIVFFSGSLPSEDEFLLLAVFPQVFYIKGNCRRKRDLNRLNAVNAARVVIFGNQVDDHHVEEFPDLQSVLAKHLITNAVEEAHAHNRLNDQASELRVADCAPFITVELFQRQSIRFLGKHQIRKKSKKWRANTTPQITDITYDPLFASGQVFTAGLLDNILFQTYFNNNHLDIIKLLCGVRSHSELLIDRELGIESSYLSYIDVPKGFVDRPFGYLYQRLAVENGAIALGLYRAPDEKLRNKSSFVYTNPPPELLVKSTDLVYILSKLWMDDQNRN